MFHSFCGLKLGVQFYLHGNAQGTVRESLIEVRCVCPPIPQRAPSPAVQAAVAPASQLNTTAAGAPPQEKCPICLEQPGEWLEGKCVRV